MLVTFAPDTKLVASTQKPTSTPSMKPNSNDSSKSFSFNWKFPFGDDKSNPKEKKDSVPEKKDSAPASEESNDAATKDAAEKAFVFETPNKSDKEVMDGIDDVSKDMKNHAKDGSKLLDEVSEEVVSPRSHKPPKSPKTGNPRKSGKSFIDMNKVKDAKRKERDSSQKQKKWKVIDSKRIDADL